MPPSYPLRPVNGGPLPKALPKSGRWLYEPKVNGWRAWVHTPTGRMFNRENKPLSIANEFAAILHVLEDATNDPAFEWLDVECFERRHPLGRGSLVLLDMPLHPGNYEQRQNAMYELITIGVAQSWAFEHFPPPENSLLLFAYSFEECCDPEIAPLAGWQRLQEVNRKLGCELFEGMVAKRADSPYPFQLRSPGVEFPFWMKHRWRF